MVQLLQILVVLPNADFSLGVGGRLFVKEMAESDTDALREFVEIDGIEGFGL